MTAILIYRKCYIRYNIFDIEGYEAPVASVFQRSGGKIYERKE